MSLLDNAKALRRNMTPHEHIMWQALRAGRLAAYKFKRQQPLGAYIVDFVCLQAKVVVECDGGQHMTSKHDQQRDDWLKSQGYDVMRVWNNEIVENLHGVLEALLNKLQQRRPLPNPSPIKGEGL